MVNADNVQMCFSIMCFSIILHDLSLGSRLNALGGGSHFTVTRLQCDDNPLCASVTLLYAQPLDTESSLVSLDCKLFNLEAAFFTFFIFFEICSKCLTGWRFAFLR